jgi:uncharacterized protein YukE
MQEKSKQPPREEVAVAESMMTPEQTKDSEGRFAETIELIEKYKVKLAEVQKTLQLVSRVPNLEWSRKNVKAFNDSWGAKWRQQEKDIQETIAWLENEVQQVSGETGKEEK